MIIVHLYHTIKEKEMTRVAETLEMIKEQTGLELQLCDYFTGVKELGGRQYFNVVLNHRVSESQEFIALTRWAGKYQTISVEPNGVNRVAIFFNQG